MTAQQSADTTPDARASRASPRPGRPAAPGCAPGRARRAVRGPGLGRFRLAAAAGRADPRRCRPAARPPGLRGGSGRSAGAVARVLCPAVPAVLASLGARLPFRLAAQVTLATFLVSHVTPFGSATGTLLNVSTLETEGIAASTTGEAIGLTSLVSTIALIALFGTGFVATAGRHLSRGLPRDRGHRPCPGRRGRWPSRCWWAPTPASPNGQGAGQAGWARHVRPRIDPEQVAQTSKRLVSLARSALTGRAFPKATDSPWPTCSSICSRSI